MTAGVDDAGRVVISVTEDRAKTRNVRRDPRAVLCVFTDRWYGPWTQLEGTADVLSLPDALEPLVEYYRTTRGEEHPDWDDYRAAMVRDRRALIRVTVARVAGTRPAS